MLKLLNKKRELTTQIEKKPSKREELQTKRRDNSVRKKEADLESFYIKAKALEDKIQDLEHDLYFDSLTGCKNKYAFDKEVGTYTSTHKYVLVAMSINLEKINANGREEGDRILCGITKLLTDCYPFTYRIGGEKFNVLINLTDFYESEFQTLCEKINTYSPEAGLYFGLVKSTDCINLPFSEILAIAIKRMYEDKKVKRPKKNVMAQEATILGETFCKDLSLQEKEALEMDKKLSEMLERKRKLEAEIIMTDNEVNLRKMNIMLIKKKRQEQENELLALKESNTKWIPNTTREPDDAETDTVKMLCTMWYSKSTISVCRDNKYSEVDIYVYPTRYEKPPNTLDIIVVVDNKECKGRESYKILFGTNVEFNVGGEKVIVNARFSKDGLKTGIICDYDTERITETHNGNFTPFNFGKRFFGKEIYPIKQNINGTCDSVIFSKKESDSEPFLEFSEGMELIEHEVSGESVAEIFSFVLDDKSFRIVKND